MHFQICGPGNHASPHSQNGCLPLELRQRKEGHGWIFFQSSGKHVKLHDVLPDPLSSEFSVVLGHSNMFGLWHRQIKFPRNCHTLLARLDRLQCGNNRHWSLSKDFFCLQTQAQSPSSYTEAWSLHGLSTWASKNGKLKHCCATWCYFLLFFYTSKTYYHRAWLIVMLIGSWLLLKQYVMHFFLCVSTCFKHVDYFFAA